MIYFFAKYYGNAILQKYYRNIAKILQKTWNPTEIAI